MVNFKKIKNIENQLTIAQNEIIIQRLVNHDYFDQDNLETIKRCLFAGQITALKFYKSDQINDLILKYIPLDLLEELKLG